MLGPGDRPLAGARVGAWDDQGRDREARTDAQGAFALDGLAEGVHQVSARAPGHVSAAARVPVTEAQGGEVTLRLAPGGRVEGRVTDPRGAAVAGANVFVYGGAERVGATNADEEGRYELDGLPVGRIDLFVRSEDYALSARVGVDVVAGALVVRDVALAEGLTLTGRVVDRSGAPAAKVRVLAVELGGDVVRDGVTDDDGRYRVQRLYPGRYGVAIGTRDQQTEPRRLAEVDVTTGSATCDLILPPASVVRGSVVGPRGPVPGAQVHAIEGGEHRGTTRTDDAGRFALQGLVPGRYRLFVREGEDRLVGHLDVDLPEGAALEDQRLVAHAPARARGRVVDPRGQPVPGLALTLRAVGGFPVERSARTDADGRFELGPLYDGEYELTADDGALQLLARRLELVRLELTTRRVSVSRGDDVACDVQVRVPPG